MVGETHICIFSAFEGGKSGQKDHLFLGSIGNCSSQAIRFSVTPLGLKLPWYVVGYLPFWAIT